MLTLIRNPITGFVALALGLFSFFTALELHLARADRACQEACVRY